MNYLKMLQVIHHQYIGNMVLLLDLIKAKNIWFIKRWICNYIFRIYRSLWSYYVIKGVTHTKEPEQALLFKLMRRLREAVNEWKKETGLGFALYGTPAESLTNRFCIIDRSRFGDIEGITDKGYYTNSYHVFVKEEINIFDKFRFESQFQSLSTGGCISYGEIPNMLITLMQ